MKRLSDESFDSDAETFSGDEAFNACGATDAGRVRPSNQDQFLIAQLNKSMRVSATSLTLDERLYGHVQGEILLVADGMGGHAAGEKASRLAIGHLVRQLLGSVHWHFQGDEDDETQFRKNLQQLLKKAHARILMESAQHLDQRGMGTTLTMAYLVWPTLYVVHAGDSRCYLVRNRKAIPLTTDHTLARQMVEAGGLKPEEEADSKWSNVLWNVLGGRADGELTADVRREELRAGDAIVLCSDGLHRYIDEAKLARVVSEAASPAEACERLIELANQAGGEDNITVVVSRPEAEDLQKTTWFEDFETTVPPDLGTGLDEVDPRGGGRPSGGPADDELGGADPIADTLPD